MRKKEIMIFMAKACFAGAAIGLGAVASLYANSILAGPAGRLVGACFFTVGMFVIITYEMKLFTGMVASVTALGVKNLWQLPVCFLCNAVGIGAVALLARFSFLGDAVAAQAASLMSGKLASGWWYLEDLCSAALCGVLITFSVRSVRAAPEKGLSPTLGVVLPIAVFAFCGFDHSVANMLYFYYLGEVSWQVLAYILLTVVGNFLGGAAFPFVLWLAERKKKAAMPEAKAENVRDGRGADKLSDNPTKS